MDGIDSNRLIEFIFNEIFIWFLIVLFVGKLISVVFVVESIVGFIFKVV